MKRRNHLFFVLITALLITSCGSNKTQEVEQNEELPGKPLICTYSYQNDSTLIKWTAYKLTERAGVEGEFKKFTVEGTTANEDPKLALTGATFSIETQSTETNDTARNGKIFRHFFKVFNTEIITGKILKFNDDGSKASLSLTMNNIEKEIEANVKWDEESVLLKTEINLEDWNYASAMTSLNKACKEKHTGADGITKVWPDVSIVVKTTLAKNCSE